MKIRAIRFDKHEDIDVLLKNPIKDIDWSNGHASTNRGLCFFPINCDPQGWGDVMGAADDIYEFGNSLSRELGHSCEEALVVDLNVNFVHFSHGFYSFYDYICEVGISDWDFVDIVARIPIYKQLSWKEVLAL